MSENDSTEVHVVMRETTDHETYGGESMTEIRGIYDTLEEARKEMEQDLIREYGRDSFTEYGPDEDGEDEIKAVAPEGIEYRVYIDTVTTKAKIATSQAPAAQVPAPPVLPRTVYIVVAEEKQYHDQEEYEHSVAIETVYDSILAANRAARHHILYELTDGEGRGGREFFEKNRDSRDLPYSATLFNIHDDLDEMQIRVRSMSVDRSRPELAAGPTGQHSNGAIKRPAPSGGSEHSANKQQRVHGTVAGDDDEVVCLS